MRSRATLAAALERPLTLADVGVRWGFRARWTAHAPPARLIGFDADEEECERLARRHAGLPGAQFVPVALADRDGRARLHVTADPASSSLLEPDPEAAAARPALAGAALAHVVEVPVRTLRGWAAEAGVEGIDGLALDVQGGELAVLRGAGRLLGDVRAVAVEVELNPIYREQPLFGDVDRVLREAGLVLWTLDDLHFHAPAGAARLGLRRLHQNHDGLAFATRSGPGQLFWAEATYVRRETALGGALPWPLLARDALLADAFGLDDLARHLLERLADEAPAPVAGAARGDLRAGRLGRRARRLAWEARRRDATGAARRLVHVRRLARRGLDPAAISAATGLTEDNVRLLLRVAMPRTWFRA